MQHKVCAGDDGFCWTDVVAPTRKELAQLGAEYKVHSAWIKDALDPAHLPKHERFGALTFVIARPYDRKASPHADTVLELTRKISLIVGPNFLLTVHRTDLPLMAELRAQWEQRGLRSSADISLLMSDLVLAVLQTYERPVEEARDAIDRFEAQVFRGESTPTLLQELYFVRRKASVFKRILRLTSEVMPKLDPAGSNAQDPRVQDLRETADRLLYQADDLVENVNQLVNLHISLSSHRTNEVMRVLTVFSVFFMPLTFIVGVYGMNFRHMPELDWRWGYLAVWILMLAVCVVILLWFRRKGWLSGFRRTAAQRKLELELLSEMGE